LLSQRDNQITKLDLQILNKKNELKDHFLTIQQRDDTITDLNNVINEKGIELQGFMALVQQGDEVIAELTALVEEKNNEVLLVLSQLSQKEKDIEGINEKNGDDLDRLRRVITEKDNLVGEKNKVIFGLEDGLGKKNVEILDWKNKFEQNEKIIENLKLKIGNKTLEIDQIKSSYDAKVSEYELLRTKYREKDELLHSVEIDLKNTTQKNQDLTENFNLEILSLSSRNSTLISDLDLLNTMNNDTKDRILQAKIDYDGIKVELERQIELNKNQINFFKTFFDSKNDKIDILSQKMNFLAQNIHNHLQNASNSIIIDTLPHINVDNLDINELSTNSVVFILDGSNNY
jgi:chromosome segregation ATPase